MGWGKLAFEGFLEEVGLELILKAKLESAGRKVIIPEAEKLSSASCKVTHVTLDYNLSL
jgi:hypothetical protein